jgi:hypothetical protein
VHAPSQCEEPGKNIFGGGPLIGASDRLTNAKRHTFLDD